MRIDEHHIRFGVFEKPCLFNLRGRNPDQNETVAALDRTRRFPLYSGQARVAHQTEDGLTTVTRDYTARGPS